MPPAAATTGAGAGAAEQVLAAPGARSWGAAIAFAVRRLLWRARLSGSPVPADGPLVLAVNHVNILDGPLVYSAFPRHSHFLVKVEMFRGIFGWALRGVGQIPIDRSGADRAALAAALHALRSGRVVGVFPEGGRGRGDVTAVRTGVAWLALQSGAPVLPVAVLGTRVSGQPAGSLPRLGRRVHVVVGEAFGLERPPGASGRAALAAAAEQVRSALAAHVAAAALATGVTLPADSGRDEG